MNVMTGLHTSLMTAAIVTGPGAIVTEARPLPQPGPGQVRIRL
ncbi:MAG TPA: L-iditol 2-dehydrogenase, partial [Pseudorhizobium sp.]|nr:L-iditol 2-dehydrogenase [Pseudorhizobium sp.]